MGGPLLIDTNVLIDLFKGRLPTLAEEKLVSVLNNDEYYLSVITKIELLGFKTDDTLQMQFLAEIVENSTVLALSDEIVERTILLRGERKIKLPDSIIAATALVHNLTLISRNVKDFAHVAQLIHINPYAL